MSLLTSGAYLALCGLTIALLVFINSSQAIVLTEVLDQVENARSISSNLALADELTCIIVAPLWGSISDTWGAHNVASIGLLLMSLGLWQYPFVSSVYPGLVIARIVFALGASACVTMMTALISILRQNTQKIQVENVEGDEDMGAKYSGRMSGIAGLFSGLGAVAAVSLLLPLPAWLGLATTPVPAVQDAFRIVAALTAVSAVALWRVLPRSQEAVEALDSSTVKSYKSHFCNVIKGFTAVKDDSNLVLAYAGSFFARASSVFVALFVPLILIQLYHKNGKCGTSDETHGCRAGVVDAAIATGIANTIGLVVAPLVGLFAKNKRRVGIVLVWSPFAFSVGMCLISFCSEFQWQKTLLWFILGSSLVVVCQMGFMTTSMAICAWERQAGTTPPGTIAGAYTMSGSLGILAFTQLARLFP